MPGSYTVNATVNDGNSSVSASAQQEMPAPSSGGLGVPNISDNKDPVNNPLNGITVTVAASNGGVVQLGIDINSLTRDAFSVQTEFGDIAGRSTSVFGLHPTHQFLTRGIFIAKVTATSLASGQVAGFARKMLVISTKETDEHLPAVRAPNNIGDSLQTLTDPPNNLIATKSIKGKFIFDASKADSVSYSGTLKLPGGLNTKKPHEFDIGIGNIVANASVDAHGKGAISTGSGGGTLLKKLKLTYLRIPKGGISKGGEEVRVDATFSTAGLVAAGFDTEGISNRATDVSPTQAANRNIQIGMLLDGVPYEILAPVTFSVSKDSLLGTIQGRK